VNKSSFIIHPLKRNGIKRSSGLCQCTVTVGIVVVAAYAVIIDVVAVEDFVVVVVVVAVEVFVVVIVVAVVVVEVIVSMFR